MKQAVLEKPLLPSHFLEEFELIEVILLHELVASELGEVN
jgi:hypothetical protein